MSHQRDRLPTPLLALIRHVANDEGYFRRVHRLIDAFEWAIKWHTALAVSDLLTTANLSPRMKLLLSAGLRSPSLGLWHCFFREASSELESPFAPYGAWARLNDLEARHRIVGFRNKYAHGATPSEDECAEDLTRFEPVLTELVGSRLFTELVLVGVGDAGAVGLRGDHPAPMEFGGEAGHAYARSPDGRTLDLWPLGLFITPEKRRGRRDAEPAFFFFNALRLAQVEQLNYEFAILERDSDLWEPFHRRFPLKAWARESSAGLGHLRTEIELLTENFRGREQERRSLKEFCLDGTGCLMVWGSPGIGKSALIAQTVKEIASGIGPDEATGVAYPAVIQYHVRRDWHTEREATFVDSLARSLDETYGLPGLATATTPEERAQGLRARCAMVDDLHDRPRSVLFIDGLDENPDLLDLVPMPRAWLAIVLSSRPVHRVDAWYRQWARDTLQRSELTVGPLGPRDVRALLYGVADKYQEAFTEDYVTTLTNRSEGNPMFLRLLCDEVFDSGGRLLPVATIPKNVEDLYAATMQRVTRNGTDDDAARLVFLLCEAGAAVDRETIAAVLGVNPLRAQAALSAVRELLIDDDGTRDSEALQLFHLSLREWLRAEHGGACADMQNHLADWSIKWPGPSDRSPRSYAVEHAVQHVSAAKASAGDDETRSRVTALLVDSFVDEKLRLGLEHTLLSDVRDLCLLAGELNLEDALVAWLVRMAARHPSLESAVHWGTEAAIVVAPLPERIERLMAALGRRPEAQGAILALRVAKAASIAARDAATAQRAFAFVTRMLRSTDFAVRQAATGALSELLLEDAGKYTAWLQRFPVRRLLRPWRWPDEMRELNGIAEASFRVLGHRRAASDLAVREAFLRYAAATGVGTALVRSPALMRSLASHAFSALAKRQFKYAIGIEGNAGLFGDDAKASQAALLQTVDVLLSGRCDDMAELIRSLNSPTPLHWMAAMAAAMALAQRDEDAFLGVVVDAAHEAGFDIGPYRGSGDVVPFRSLNLVKMLTHCRPATSRHAALLRDLLDEWIEISPHTAFQDPRESIYVDNEFAPFAPLMITECRLRASDDLSPIPSVQHYADRFADEPKRLLRLFADLRKPAHYAPQRVLGTLLWGANDLPKATLTDAGGGFALAYWFVHSQHPALAVRFADEHPTLRSLLLGSPGPELSRVIFSSVAAESWEFFATRLLYESQEFREFLGDVIRRVALRPSIGVGIGAVVEHLAVLLARHRVR